MKSATPRPGSGDVPAAWREQPGGAARHAPYAGGVDSAAPGSPAGSERSIGQAALEIVERLHRASPDTGDDRTKVVLDDALDRLEARLARLAEDHR